MEFFKGAKVVKLRSHLEKFLIADGDRETVRQSRTGSTGSRARWAVEFPPDEGSGGGGGYSSSTAIRLRSCHTGRYLTASDAPLLLGATGKKVMQSELATKWDPRVDWVPVRDGFQVKLRAAAAGAAEDGGDYNYLRANGGPPPWRNSVTHDRAHAVKKGHRWALWDVEEASDDDGGDDINSIFSESPTISSLPSTPSFESAVLGGTPPIEACQLLGLD